MTMSCHNTLHYTPMTFRSRVDLLDHVRESLDSYLPDPSVIGADEEPRKAAEDLVAFCERELTKIGETLDRVAAQHLDEYRECVVNALVAAEDYLAGGRDYYVVYGNVETHFLTGDPTPDSQLDAWVRQGGKFTATTSGDRFAFELDGLEQLQVPQAIHNRAQAGETIEFTDDRGVKFEVSPSRFPNGEMGSSTRVIYSPIDNADVWMWYATRTGSGSTLDEAIKASFEAEPVARKRK